MEDVKIGQTVWFANGTDELSSGKVIHIFEHEGIEIYVIEVDTAMGPYYEAREWNSIALGPRKNLNLYTKNARLPWDIKTKE